MKSYLTMKPRKIDWPDGRKPTRESCMTGTVLVDSNVFVDRNGAFDPAEKTGTGMSPLP